MKEKCWIIYNPETDEYVSTMTFNTGDNKVKIKWARTIFANPIESFPYETSYRIIVIFYDNILYMKKRIKNLIYTRDDINKWVIVRADKEDDIISAIDFTDVIPLAELLKS
jgi:hypothetical protein